MATSRKLPPIIELWVPKDSAEHENGKVLHPDHLATISSVSSLQDSVFDTLQLPPEGFQVGKSGKGIRSSSICEADMNEQIERRKSTFRQNVLRYSDGDADPLNRHPQHHEESECSFGESLKGKKNKRPEFFPKKRKRSSIVPPSGGYGPMATIFGAAGTKRFTHDIHIGDDDEDSDQIYNYPTVEETAKVIFNQVFIPFLLAGFGNVGAGLILQRATGWSVFKNTPELYLLVSSFMGFKGNFEMTLAARLATSANLGEWEGKSKREMIKMCYGNIALIQYQSMIVAIITAILAIAWEYFYKKSMADFNLQSCLLIFSTALVTASIRGLVLAAIITIITLGSLR